MAAGFAGWLLYMKTDKKAGNQFTGSLSGEEYILQDDAAEKLYGYWIASGSNTEMLVKSVLQDERLWGEDLTIYPGFADAVTQNLDLLLKGDPGAFFPDVTDH